MAAKRKKQVAKPAPERSRREGGLPGGGQGRIDEVGRSGVFPGSGPYPSGPAELRTPAEFVHGQTDAEGRPVEGGSELIYFGGENPARWCDATAQRTTRRPGAAGHRKTGAAPKGPRGEAAKAAQPARSWSR